MTSEAVEAIRAGLVVGVPTDTVYGLGVDPLDESAVSRLFEIKGRPEHKPVGLLIGTMGQAETIGVIEDTAMALAAEHWPGALTLVVRPRVVLADWVGDSQRQTVVSPIEATRPRSIAARRISDVLSRDSGRPCS